MKATAVLVAFMAATVQAQPSSSLQPDNDPVDSHVEGLQKVSNKPEAAKNVETPKSSEALKKVGSLRKSATNPTLANVTASGSLQRCEPTAGVDGCCEDSLSIKCSYGSISEACFACLAAEANRCGCTPYQTGGTGCSYCKYDGPNAVGKYEAATAGKPQTCSQNWDAQYSGCWAVMTKNATNGSVTV